MNDRVRRFPRLRSRLIPVPVAGRLTPGEALAPVVDATVLVPRAAIETGEKVYVLLAGVPRLPLAANDILIVEPRPAGTATSGELVVAERAGRVYVGRWWGKHRKRVVLDGATRMIVQGSGVRVLGAVTAAIHPSDFESSSEPSLAESNANPN